MRDIIRTVTEASRGFSDLINRVNYRRESATLTKNGKPVARLVPVKAPMTGAELAKIWKLGAHLSRKNADAFARDLKEARKVFKPVKSSWDWFWIRQSSSTSQRRKLSSIRFFGLVCKQREDDRAP